MMRYGIGTAVIVAVSVAAYFFYPSATDSLQPPSDYNAQKEDIARLVGSYDAKNAYELFKVRYANLPQEEQHQAAHLFGEALYAKGGIDDFSVCDGNFGFGCFHSFISLAIADHGEGVALELDKKCVEAYSEQGLGCVHGIGHGLLSYYGYDEQSLSSALALCNGLSWKRQYGGCQEGVFMEYDFRTMAENDGNKLREFDQLAPLTPCTSVDQKFRVACYFSIPALWSSGGMISPKEMSTWCAKAARLEERNACYRGIGHGIPPSVSFSYEGMRDGCDSIEDGGARLMCREGAAWMLYATPETREKAKSMCTEGLTPAHAEQCESEFLFVIQ